MDDLMWIALVLLALLVVCVHRLCNILLRIRRVLESGVISVRDVERAKVYSEHLGEKLRTGVIEKLR